MALVFEAEVGRVVVCPSSLSFLPLLIPRLTTAIGALLGVYAYRVA